MASVSVNTNSLSLIAAQPLEMLLISSGSPDPHSTLVIDPRTGVSGWSYKGSELQGASTGYVEPLGTDGRHIVVTTKDRPLVHVLAVHPKDRFHQKTVLPGPVGAICSDRRGRYMFVSIRKQIYVWLLSTGELLSVSDTHYQDVTKIALSEDESMLFTASKDGSIHGYLVTDLVSVDRDHTVAPFRKWATHTLSVKDMYITKGLNPRVVSCGLDHIAAVHSVSLDSTILKISADRALTSCCIDPAETRIFVGTDVGAIAQVDLYDLKPKERELLVQTSDDTSKKFRLFNGHSDEITKMCVNMDGSLLASGDASGKYCIWEISSHQCLKVSTMRSSIMTLRFLPYWSSLSSSIEYVAPKWRPVWELQREPTKLKNLALEICDNLNADEDQWERILDDQIDQLLHEINNGRSGEHFNLTNGKSVDESNVDANETTVAVEGDDDDEDGAPIIGNASRRVSNKKKQKKKKAKLAKEQLRAEKVQKQATTSNQNQEEDDSDDVVIVDTPETQMIRGTTKRQQNAQSEGTSEVESLRREVAKLREINRKLYDFAAKEIVTTD